MDCLQRDETTSSVLEDFEKAKEHLFKDGDFCDSSSLRIA